MSSVSAVTVQHNWYLPTLMAARKMGLAPTTGWITCRRCGAQICQTGWGAQRKYWHRQSAAHEWLEAVFMHSICSGKSGA